MKPSLKNAGMVVVALIIIGGSFILNERLQSAPQEPAPSKPAIVATAATSSDLSSLDKDTDGDGLKDWEEVLWGTNDQDSDTDEDGIADGKEVLAGSSPTIKGNGKLQASSTVALKPLTATDKFGRELFTYYTQLRQAGLSSDSDSQERLVQQLLESGTLAATAKVYSSKDLVISNTTSDAAARQYVNSVGSTFLRYSVKGRSEPAIVKESIETNNPSILAELDPIIAANRLILNQLLKTQAPSDAAALHLELVNTMSAVLFVDEAFKKIQTDPIVSLQAISQYPVVSQTMLNVFLAVRQYATNYGFKFEATEGGILFNPTP
ncbi:MAG: hypothetical protein V4526_02205 [Patescibacteria group bacterium]